MNCDFQQIVYPNPCNAYFYYEYQIAIMDKNPRIELIDSRGIILESKSITVNFGFGKMDVTNLKAGKYVLRIGNISKSIVIQ